MKAITKFLAIALVLGACSFSAFAGPVRGPLFDVTRAQAYGKVTYHEAFRAGELATISIAGDRDTDLDIYVYDENGNLVTSATGLSDHESCTFVPRWTGNFRIEVRNLGGVWNQYRIDMR